MYDFSEPVSAMIFGKLGREDHVLVLITTGFYCFNKKKTIFLMIKFVLAGSLIVKILKRTAEFKVNSNSNSLNDTSTPATGNLMIPKKTKVFVEQTVRERDNASSKIF